MRTKLVLLFTLCLCLPAIVACSTRANPSETKPVKSELVGAKTAEMLFIADSKETILAWGKQHIAPDFGGNCAFFEEYTHGDNHAIVMLLDYGSGLSHNVIYIFGKSGDMKAWCLILYCPTGTRVSVRQENDKLILTNELTDAKDVIWEQSLENLWVVGQYAG
jgi:hypothetical protein